MQLTAKSLLLFALVAVITGLSACCPKVDCAVGRGIVISLHGFQPADVDTIYTTGYAAGTGFTQVTREEQVDTVEIGYADTVYNLRPKIGYALQDHHEWKIYIPSVNRTMYVSDYGYRLINCNKCMFRKSEPDMRMLHSCIFDGKRQLVEDLRINK